MNIVSLITQFESYLLTKKRVSHNTHQSYSQDLKQFLLYCQSNKITIQRLFLKNLKSFLEFLKKKGLSARSMARKISCLKSFFTYLHEYHSFENIAEQLHIPKIEQKLPHHLSEEEIEQLFQEADRIHSPFAKRNSVMLYVLYGSGARISEIINLKVDNIDFTTGFITFFGKGSKQRMVPLSSAIMKIIQNYLATTYLEITQQKIIKYTNSFLFPTYYNQKLNPISRQSFWMYLKKIAIKSGIKKMLSPHILRHSLATHLLKKGANLRSLQLFLGHEQLNTVQVYTHLDTQHLRKIYDAKHPRA